MQWLLRFLNRDMLTIKLWNTNQLMLCCVTTVVYSLNIFILNWSFSSSVHFNVCIYFKYFVKQSTHATLNFNTTVNFCFYLEALFSIQQKTLSKKTNVLVLRNNWFSQRSRKLKALFEILLFNCRLFQTC